MASPDPLRRAIRYLHVAISEHSSAQRKATLDPAIGAPRLTEPVIEPTPQPAAVKQEIPEERYTALTYPPLPLPVSEEAALGRARSIGWTIEHDRGAWTASIVDESGPVMITNPTLAEILRRIGVYTLERHRIAVGLAEFPDETNIANRQREQAGIYTATFTDGGEFRSSSFEAVSLVDAGMRCAELAEGAVFQSLTFTPRED